jgi:hypothetical protein
MDQQQRRVAEWWLETFVKKGYDSKYRLSLP